jgi:hypothetical protein
MRMTIGAWICALVLCGASAFAGEKAAEDPFQSPFANPSGGAAKVDAVFVLDSTGSMSGLIEGAKRKVWAIAQAILSGDPKPQVRFGLISYRDLGDEYVTKVFDLNADLDKVYENLRDFKANGGGDEPESVAQALTEAVTKMSWTDDKKTLRIIFLVGDAPPHTDYDNGFDYKKAVKMAADKDIRVNAVQCGNVASTAKFWKEIADAGKGEYAAILQDGGMKMIATPADDQIAEVSRKLGGTAVAYGGAGARAEADKKVAMLEKMDSGALADRAGYVREAAAPGTPAPAAAKAMGFGGWDLVAAVEAKTVKLEEVKDADLPDEMKKMTAEERKAHVDKKIAERAALKAELTKLSKERDEYIAKKTKEGGGAKDAFDAKVMDMLKKQAAEKGIKYADEKPATK